ncbi:MAG TPA: glycosyltransferase [Solirubrobacterales bacterium]|nr:glycosyltransferase [Solirubrobacterales bacterium]
MADGGGLRYGGSPELTVVIPTLDATSGQAQRCVASIKEHTGVDHEVVLVHNAMPPQGFTAPVNSGIRAARGDYVVVMNDDVCVLAGWWPPLRTALDEGAFASFPVTQDGFHRNDFTGWCFAISRETVARFGHSAEDFFDPQFKVWYQDRDFLLRLCEAGHPPVVAAGAGITHQLSQTLEQKDDEALSRWVERQKEEDRKALARKWPGGGRGPLARQLLSLVPDP